MAEAMAHLKLKAKAIPTTFKLICIDVDAAASMARVPALPPGWQGNEPATRAVGDAWLLSGASLVMEVPSAVIDHSTNYLINPMHSEMAAMVKERSIEPFWFDKRYLK
jgi:RES domain-containing protein